MVSNKKLQLVYLNRLFSKVLGILILIIIFSRKTGSTAYKQVFDNFISWIILNLFIFLIFIFIFLGGAINQFSFVKICITYFYMNV